MGRQQARSNNLNISQIFLNLSSLVKSRDGTEQLANQLTKRGVPCLAYHAGLKAGERSKVQEDWMDGKVGI